MPDPKAAAVRPTAPPQVQQSRQRRLAGERLPDRAPAAVPEPAAGARPWYCRTCGVQQDAAYLPHGWFSLTRHTGSVSLRPMRLGIYCSLACLEAQLPRLAGIQADLDAKGIAWWRGPMGA